MLTDLAGKVLIKNYILLDTQTRTLDEKVRERYIYIYIRKFLQNMKQMKIAHGIHSFIYSRKFVDHFYTLIYRCY